MSYEVTFADNTEVTLENMNDIARDLGDTEFSGFSTNKFGVDTLNNITSDLISSGILRTEENANMGCEPVISGSNVIIAPGVIVFETGAKLRITEAEALVKTNSTYVYAYNNHLTGLASIVVSETAPTNQMDAVLICRINANGTLIDMRSAAVAKVSLTADAENVSKIINIVHDSITNSYFEIDTGWNGWMYMICRTTNPHMSPSYFRLEDGESFYGLPTSYNTNDVRVSRNGSIIRIESTSYIGSGNIDLEVELR